MVERERDPEGRFVIVGVGVPTTEERGFDDGGPIDPVDAVAIVGPLMRTLLPRADTPLPGKLVTEEEVSDRLLFLMFSVSDIADGGL